jgi:hypothetical protein
MDFLTRCMGGFPPQPAWVKVWLWESGMEVVKECWSWSVKEWKSGLENRKRWMCEMAS